MTEQICRYFKGVDERDGIHIVKCGGDSIEFDTMETYRVQSERCVGGQSAQCEFARRQGSGEQLKPVSVTTPIEQPKETRETEAVELHQYILAQGRVMGQAMSEIGRSLKRMRDEKLYLALGNESFEDYTTKMLELKQRQAYNYIKVYETYGARFLDEHAQLGVSKLLLLADVPAPEREDFLAEHNVTKLSTRALAELTEKYNKQAEQLTLLQGELEHEKDSGIKTSDELTRTLEQERQRYREAEERYLAQLREMENRPVEVAVQEPDAQTLECIRQVERERAEEVARREAFEQFKAQKQQAEQQAKEKIEAAQAAAAEAEQRAKAEIESEKQKTEEVQRLAKERLEEVLAKAAEAEHRAATAAQEQAAFAEHNSELERARQRARELEQKLQVAENPVSLRVSFGFEQLQQQLENIDIWISEATPAEACKYRAAAKALLLQMAKRFDEVTP